MRDCCIKKAIFIHLMKIYKQFQRIFEKKYKDKSIDLKQKNKR
jgi:hypothetical protein